MLCRVPVSGYKIVASDEDGFRSVTLFRCQGSGWSEVPGARDAAVKMGLDISTTVREQAHKALRTEAPTTSPYRGIDFAALKAGTRPSPSPSPSPDAAPSAPTLPVFGDDQQAAFDDIVAGKNVLITGPGGNGKSFIIRAAIDSLRKRGRVVAVCGSTGVAAVNVGGMTIHSTLGTGWSRNLKEWREIMSAESLQKARARLDDVDVIVLDEISMLTGDYIEMMNWWLNYVKSTPGGDTLFGGIQIICVGDFLQLPPVVKKHDAKPEYLYAFESPAWKAARFEEHYLRKGYRQGDPELRRHLLRVRRGLSPDDTLAYFNQRVKAVPPAGIDPTEVFPTNREVDAVNALRLNALPGPDWNSAAAYTGHPKWIEALKESMRFKDDLLLRVGAEVLLLTNSAQGGWVNGTLGVVEELGQTIKVRGTKGQLYVVAKETQEMKDAQGSVLASVKQFPLALGWAITVHRVQGATLEYMYFDPSKVFERHMAYVALSRVKSLEGLLLKSPLRKEHIRASGKVVKYYDDLLEKMKRRSDARKSAV